MHPVTRIWAISAACLAALCLLRGLWPLAAAIFLLSPAPAWAFARGGIEQAHASASWLRAVAIAAAAIAALYVVALAMGGIPPVHEWRGALFGR